MLFWYAIKFFICKKSLKQGMVCVYSIKNERVMVILEEKTENAKNIFPKNLWIW